MKCPYCDSLLDHGTETCPHCGAQQLSYETPEPPVNTVTEEPKSSSSRKNNRLFLVLMILFMLIPALMSGMQLVESASIKRNSTLTQATLVDSNNAYADMDRSSRKRNGKRRAYYKLEVYQHLVVEYTMDDRTVCQDIGVHPVYETESRYRFTEHEQQQYVSNHTYAIGDVFDIYVTDSAEVHLASEVNAQSRSSVIMLLVAGGVLVLLGYTVFVKQKKIVKKV